MSYKSTKGGVEVNVMNKGDLAKDGPISEGGHHDSAEKVKIGDNEAAYTTMTGWGNA